MLHDTHAHLEMLIQKLELVAELRNIRNNDFDIYKVLDSVENLDQILADFNHVYLSNHDWIIHPSVSLQNFKLINRLFANNPKIHFLFGAHPEIVDVDFDPKAYIQNLKVELYQIANLPKLVGIGEIGLDYFYTKDLDIVKKQKELFRSHIELALSLDLPIEIHTRDAFSDTFSILDEYPLIHGRFLIHCFTGDTDDLRGVLDRGGKAAFGGIVTFPKSTSLQEACIYCPLDALVLETDLPFLAPTPHRGKTCIPSMIADTAQKVADLKKTTPEKIWEWSLKNSQELFLVG